MIYISAGPSRPLVDWGVWDKLDALIGRAVRRELGGRALRIALVLLCLCGVLGSVLLPSSAAVLLIFPLLVTSFFEGPWVGAALAPFFVWLLPGTWVDQLCFSLLCVFSVSIAGITASKYREVYAQRRSLLERLSLAREVQRRMQPKSVQEAGGLRISTRMEICEELGGDFVEVREVEHGILVLLGDVQGKGPQSALTAAFLDGVFCAGAEAARPFDVLRSLHECLAARDGERFVTAVCVLFDGRSFEVACGGHPLPMVLGARPRRVGESGIVLGLAGMFEVGVTSFSLEPGERLVLFSDGCFEEEGVCTCEDLWCAGSSSDDRTMVVLEPVLVTSGSSGGNT